MPMIHRREIGKGLILALSYNYFFAYHKTNKQKQKNEREKKKAGRTLNKFVSSCCGSKPIYTKENFWYGSGKNGSRTKKK